jgi:hypothetical protein
MIFPVDTYDILFGIPNPNNDTIILHMNYLILHAMYFIYKTKQKDQQPELKEFLIEAKSSLQIMQINMETKGQNKKFDKLWAPLMELL